MIWFSSEVRKTRRGIVVVAENVEGNKTIDVLLHSDHVKEIVEVAKSEGLLRDS